MWVMLENVPGRSGEVRARVIDVAETGIGIEMPFWLREGELVGVKGPASLGLNGKGKARVVHCVSVADGYRAGLLFEERKENVEKPSDSIPDYYEILQISPKADPDMIHRVFRLLAQRYHPDNNTSGNDKAFREVAEAYKVLSDPEKRAAYDVNYQANRLLRWQIFDQGKALGGKSAEKAKRRGILELLYTARRNDPVHPTLTLFDLEDMLGCPREHLEFSLWYLKENGLIMRSDNAKYTITAKGVDYAESEFPDEVQRTEHLLPAAEETVA
jgi:hypothetical protein